MVKWSLEHRDIAQVGNGRRLLHRSQGPDREAFYSMSQDHLIYPVNNNSISNIYIQVFVKRSLWIRSEDGQQARSFWILI